MKFFIIIVLLCLIALGLWPRKSGSKRTTARTWPVGRGKTGIKPKLAARL